jgi:hypothetical protein
VTAQGKGAAPAAPAGRDWEVSARARLERVVADAVDRIRQSADQIEREAKRNIRNAAKDERDLEFQTYVRAAGQVVHEVQTLAFNLPLENLIDAATDAERARIERLANAAAIANAPSLTREADKLAGAVNALTALERAAKGWAEGSHENEVAMGHRDVKTSDEQPFVLADILNMVDDAAREVGVAPVYGKGEGK